MSAPTTLYPSFRNARAVAAPMPCAVPVTTATCDVMSFLSNGAIHCPSNDVTVRASPGREHSNSLESARCEYTMRCNLVRWLDRPPARTALIDVTTGKGWTYAELADAVR